MVVGISNNMVGIFYVLRMKINKLELRNVFKNTHQMHLGLLVN